MSGTSALGRWESYWQLLLWTPHQCSLTLLGRSQEPAWTAVRKMLREGSIAAVYIWARPLWSSCLAPPAEPRPPGGPDQRLVGVSPPWTQQWANSRIGQQQLNHFRRKFAIHGRNIHKAVPRNQWEGLCKWYVKNWSSYRAKRKATLINLVCTKKKYLNQGCLTFCSVTWSIFEESKVSFGIVITWAVEKW